ncbi:unnamed protein product [Diatraea saccharalis]|uniref:VWFC domain-containing protein n=1 Tax=Diatraea saccharalis TaxID=40085 RepID=A0A9N9WAJ8_9NEOP|nr:unnamed protein product [Diatraea saccharalis]
MGGDEFPGSGPCERCSCIAGDVKCSRQRCEPRPGCKALHRPDQCCPTYQCECEQDGRTYGNGEKLVDPADPCRVCYCQGGEVVCRRIACFRRDDCQPRLVPGRCCPEYDNCPLRGVTTIPGIAPTSSSISSIDSEEPSAVPPVSKENLKHEITIKEITPVSEIPVITDVKIKEILPSPSIEVAEYSSSKSPLIPREATSEKSPNSQQELTERPVIIEIHPSSSPVFIAPSSPEIVASSSEISEVKTTHDLTPSKISLSTQDSTNSEIYPSQEPVLGTVGSPSVIQEVIPVATTTKPPIVLEEDDQSLFEHNPAFPPIPDDLSLLGSHQDEINSDPIVEDHVSSSHDVVSVTSTTTESHIVTESQSTTLKHNTETTTSASTSEIVSKGTEPGTTSFTSSPKQSPMLNLRSAIPTEILNVPSYAPEDINGELDDVNETASISEQTPPATTTENIGKTDGSVSTEKSTPNVDKVSTNLSIPGIKILEVTTAQNVDISSTKSINEKPTTFVAKSNTATEITAQTEFSSLPIETSDQNPSEEIGKNKVSTLSAETTVMDVAPTNLSPVDGEEITASKEITANTETQPLENIETTDFILTSIGSSETATDAAIEVIKVSPEVGKNAAIIESSEGKKNNVLNDLINLVGDVASIRDHNDSTVGPQHVTSAPSISESEELIPVNAGYKSKNNNWNVNSITEIPKVKNSGPVIKQKVIEIEDDESESLTDSPPPNDKVEPTTRRPIIDNVSDDKLENQTESEKDIEIIPQTFVPSVDRRPTKVVMKKNNEKPLSDNDSIGGHTATSSAATVDGNDSSSSSEFTTPSDVEITSTESKTSTEDVASTFSSSTAQ